MMTRSRRALLLATALLPMTPALAADYDPPIVYDQADEYVPVEVGSGWYLRGDIGYVANKSYKNRELAISGAFAQFAPFTPTDLYAVSEKETPIFGSAGFGFHFNDYLRAELNLGMLPRDRFGASDMFAGGCAGTETSTTTFYDGDGNPIDPPVVVSGPSSRDCFATMGASNTSWTGTANGFIDLGTVAGITPYVGAGAGLVYTRNQLDATAICEADETTTADGVTSTTTTFLCDGQTDASDPDVEYVGAHYTNRDYSFLYSLSAGLAYQMTKNTSLDLGYQYVSAPQMQYLKLGAAGPEVAEGMDYHQVKLGLRYDLW